MKCLLLLIYLSTSVLSVSCGPFLLKLISTAMMKSALDQYGPNNPWTNYFILKKQMKMANGAMRGMHKKFIKYAFKYQSPLPLHFDARDRWPECRESINRLSKQSSSCGSCWALAVADAASDRLCIASKGRIQTRLSARRLMECIEKFTYGQNGTKLRENQCDVGDPWVAWRFFKKDGFTSDTCRPYLEPPDHIPLACVNQCENQHQNFTSELYFGREYRQLPNNVKEIKLEIMLHGPVVAVFDTYPSIHNYRRRNRSQHSHGGLGVYRAGPEEEQLGAHAVRLVGWGIEDGNKYWIGLNTWGRGWGVGGELRIARGVNECGIEDYVTSGLPNIR